MMTPNNCKADNNPKEGESRERRAPRSRPLDWRWYRSYGLYIRSQLPLPELQPEPEQVPQHSCEQADIVLGETPRTLDGGARITSWLQASARRCLLDGGDIGRYQIDDGIRITVDRRISTQSLTPAKQRDIRVYLLGTAFGALLHQRQWLPLHVSAVATQTGVLAFTGPSGAGKSTIAAWLHFRFGLPLITDDIGVIKPGDEQPWLYPGPPRLKLWDDAIRRLGLDREGLIQDLTRTEKFHFPNAASRIDEPLPLRYLVVLEPAEAGNSFRLKELQGSAAYQAIMKSVYRPGLNHLFYKKGQLHIDASALARKVKVYALERPWGSDDKEHILEKLLNQLGTN